jgi:hypothetical protein
MQLHNIASLAYSLFGMGVAKIIAISINFQGFRVISR